MRDLYKVMLKFCVGFPVIFLLSLAVSALAIRGFGIPGDSLLAIAVRITTAGVLSIPLMMWACGDES